MTEGAFKVVLAGRAWTLPHLPFRVIKSVQPALFQVYSEGANLRDGALAEAQIDRLAGAVWRAISYVEPELTFDDFLALPFSVGDLFATLPAVAQASGLHTTSATAEASPEAGKLISTL